MPDPSDRSSFVFSDPSGRRWPRLRRILLLALALAFIAVVLFARTLFVSPQLRLPLSLRQLKGQLKSLQKANPVPAPKPVPARVPLWEKFLATRKASKKTPATPAPLVARKPAAGEVHLAFYRNGDPYSYASLEQHAGQITHLCPEWLSVVNGMGDLQIDADSRLPKVTAAHGIALMPLLTNLVGDTWQPEAIENLANGDLPRQERFFHNVLAALRDAHAAGVVIDWQDLDPAYLDKIGDLIARFADALHREGRELWICVNPGEPLDLSDSDKVSEKADRFVALLYDETSEDETPGALSSRPWFQGWLDTFLTDADPQQWIIGLGSYGYDWTAGQAKADQISFAEAMSRASYADVKRFSVGGPDYNPTFDYEDGGDGHTVSFLDATTFLNELRSARRKNVGGIALFRLGLEDSAVWDAIRLPANAHPDAQLQNQLGILKGTDTIADIGEGEIVTVDEGRSDGSRAIGLDGAGNFTANYQDFPEFPTLYHQGGGKPTEVALTFDDGPDPKWTPRVLDLLKAANVKAAFFVVGVNAERYPDLVRRIVAEGHEIGNHTYYHPDLGACWPEHIRLELNATQLLLETITGRSTTLFRPPYAADTSPSGLNELIPLKIAQDLNYLVVLENIDPQDWARPGTDVIVSRVKQQRRDGNIILLHDGGGDRSQTLAALPRILDYLQTRGDTVVPLSTLMGTTRDAVMPLPQAGAHAMVRLVSGTGFRLLRDIEELLWAFLIVATALTVVRTLLVVWLATRFRRRTNDFTEPVSVLIAAYNEGKVIAATLRSVLASDYPAPLEVIVIDDGSNDNTAEEVEAIARGDVRVRLLRQRNFGKAAALSRALAAAHHGIVVFLDADTHVQPDTLKFLTQPFVDARIGAVSGHAKVGNLRSFLARCQALEYTCGFNLDRRAYTHWDCVTVVPGAISAARKTAVAAAGWLSLDTLAEDTDLTLALHRKGYRVEYAPDAIAWTEAPETVRALARQRFRWAYGTMQCLWKHRDLTFNWRYRALGWFSLPSVWFFQIILVAITPLVDFLLLASLPFGIWAAVLPFVAIFLAIDLLIALLACLLEGEPVIRAWRILPMRLIYRPLLSYVICLAGFRALKGAWVSWAKLERTASVPVRT
ncbi:MAG: glycosyltransferase [Spartobacteria bacterium]